jgi:hypothetical protein
MRWSESAAHTKCAQRIDDGTVLQRDLFSEILHYTRLRPSGLRCLLHLSIGLPTGGEEEFQNQNVTFERQRLGNSSNG